MFTIVEPTPFEKLSCTLKRIRTRGCVAVYMTEINGYRAKMVSFDPADKGK